MVGNSYYCAQNTAILTLKKIYLIRHGQTDYNKRNIVQGSGVDSSLNDTGRRQAQQFYEEYKHIAFDKIYVSGLVRTYESIQHFADAGIPVEKRSGLNEISWGNQEGQVVTPGENAYYHEMLREWQSGHTDLRIEGGESPLDVTVRLKPELTEMLSRPNETTILVCMHGRAMRVLLTMMLNYPLKSMDCFEHQNLGLYVLVYTGTMFRIERFNDTNHFNRLS